MFDNSSYPQSGNVTWGHRLGEDDPVSYPQVERLPISVKPEALYRTIPDRHALYDRVSDSVFSVVSPQYNIISHKDIADQLEEVMDNRSLKPQIRTDFENSGAWMKKTYTFDSEKYDLGNEDNISPQLFFFNGYDRRTSLSLILGAFRWICSNGQVSGEEFYSIKEQHRGILNFTVDDLDQSFDKFQDQITQWIEWKEQEATVDDYDRMVKAIKPTKAGTQWIESN